MSSSINSSLTFALRAGLGRQWLALLVTATVFIATPAHAANTVTVFSPSASPPDLTNGANYSVPFTPTAGSGFDVEFSGSYTTPTFTANSANLIFGTLDDINTTQPLVITDNGSASSITLDGGSNAVPGAAAADLLYVASSGNLAIQSGSGVLTLDLNASGNIDNAGTLSLAGPISITASDTITFTGNGATSVSGAIALSTGAITINDGAGSVTFSGNNLQTGTTTLTAGTLRATTSAGALGAGALSLGGGVLDLANTSGTNLAFGNATTVTGSTQIISDLTSGTAGNTYTMGTLSIGAQTLTVAGGSAITSGTAGVTFGATTLTGNPTFTVNNPANGGSTVLTLGSVTGADSVTKNGTGTLALAGTNLGFTGALTVSNGTVNISNNAAATSIGELIIGNTTSNSITPTINVTSGNFAFNGSVSPYSEIGAAATGARGVLNISGTANVTNNGWLMFGASAAGGTGVVNQTGGAFANNGSGIILAWNSANSYGAYLLSGGMMTSTTQISVGQDGVGLFSQSGGTAAWTSSFYLGQSGGIGVADISGGSLTESSSTTFMDGTGTGILTVRGTGSLTVAAGNINVANGGTGIVNLLNGGTIMAYGIGRTGGTGTINFDGGTLKANSTNAAGSFLTGLTNAYVYGDGGSTTVNNNSTNITIGQNLITPATGTTGYGIGNAGSTISVSSGGSGYIAPPAVTFSAPASGVAATGLAVVSGGVVTGVIITSPGSGYTTGQGVTVTFSSGTSAADAYASPATLSGVTASTLDTSGGFTFTGTGTTTLSGANTYTGGTTINGGILSVAAIADSSTSNIGPSSGATNNILTLGGGTLKYTGTAADTTIRNVSLTASSTIVVSGGSSASLGLSGAVSGGFGLTLGAGTNGTLILSGANTYTGGTTINSGVLQFNADADLPGSGGVPTAGSVTVNAGGTLAAGFAIDQNFIDALTSGSTGVVALGGVSSSNNLDFSSAGANLTIARLGATGTATYSGTLTPNGTTYRLGGGGGTLTVGSALSGANALTVGLNGTAIGGVTLTGANTYSGLTTIAAGTLNVGSGATGTGSLASGAALTFTGTGTFNVQEANGSSQNMGTLAFSAGDATVQSTYGTSGTTTLTFSNVAARTAGATANFVSSVVTNGTTNDIVFTQFGGVTTPTATLLNPGLFFNGTSYAAYDAGGFLRAYATTDTNAVTAAAGTNTIPNAAADNVFVTGAITGQAAAAINTINLAANNVTMSASGTVLQTNGILASSGTNILLTSGTLQPTTAGGELVVRVNANTDMLTISSIIQNNGTASSLTKSGLGTLVLSGVNTYNGTTTVNAGTLTLSGSGSLNGASSGGSLVVGNGATLVDNDAGNNTLPYSTAASSWTVAGTINVGSQAAESMPQQGSTNPVTLNGGTLTSAATNTSGYGAYYAAGTTIIANGTGNTISAASIGISGGLALTLDTPLATDALSVSSVLGAANGLGSVIKSGLGTVTLSGADIYTGTTTVNAGTLALTPAGSTPVINSAANGSALALGAGSLTMTGAASVNAFQQFFSTTINAGGSSISANPGAGGNFDLTLGAIARNAGGTVSFTLPTGTPALTTNGLATTTNNNSAGILGGYATVGGNWAVSAATAGTISGWVDGGTNAITFSAAQTAGNEVTFTTGTVPGGLTAATPYYVLASSTVSALSATQGGTAITLTGTSTAGAVVNSAGNISALSVYTGALPSTTSASTTANDTLAAPQTQTGVVSANSLNITDATSGDTLALAANTLTFNGTSGGLLYSGGSNFTISGTAGSGYLGSGTANEFIVTTTAGGKLTISAPLIGSATAGSLTVAGPGSVILTSINSYTGITTINGGSTLQIAGAGQLGSGAYGNNISDVGTLQYSSSANQTLSGAISGSGSLIKDTSPSALTLSGADTYTGGTTVSAGALTVSGAGSLSGTTSLSVASGATFNYLPTTAGPLTLGAGSTLNLSNNSTIGLAFGDKIVAAGAATVSGNVFLSLTGTFTSLQPYTVLTAASGLATGATYYTANNTNYTDTVSATAAAVTITPTTAAALPTAFWVGGFSVAPNVWAVSNGSTSSNWAMTSGAAVQGLVPGSATSVTISTNGTILQTPAATVLGANMTINNLTIADMTNGLGLNADGNTLTITPTSASTGITMSANVPASSIAANVALGAAQTWTNNSSIGALTVSGAVTGAFGLTTAGSGTLNLSGTNLGITGGLTVSNGILNISNNAATGNIGELIIGNTNSNSITPTVNVTSGNFSFNGPSAFDSVGGFVADSRGALNISGTANVTNNGWLMVGYDGGSGAGVVNQSGGTFNLGGVGTLLAWQGGYGAYVLSAGTLNATGSSYSLSVGHTGVGVYSQSGGTATMTNQFLLGSTGGTGVADISGGSLTHTTAGDFMTVDKESGTTGFGILTVRGTGSVTEQTGNFIVADNGTGIVNLLTGGTIVANQIQPGAGTSTINFDGGMLQAYSTNAGGSFMTGLTNAYVYGDGGSTTVNNSGTNITIGQALKTPATGTTGYGIGSAGSTIAVSSGGSGYLAPPVVTFTAPASGVAATGLAVVSGGVVTGVIITSPGTGYTTGQTVTPTFSSGASTDNAYVSPATLTGVTASTPNTSGGFTFAGSGITTLSNTGTNYTGATNITGGTLDLAFSSGPLFASPITVNPGTTLELAPTAGLTIGSAATVNLQGALTFVPAASGDYQILTGLVTVNATSTIATNGTAGSFTGLYLDGGLAGSSNLTVTGNTPGVGLVLRNSASTYSGTMTVNGTVSTAVGIGSGLDVGNRSGGGMPSLPNANLTINGTLEMGNTGMGSSAGTVTGQTFQINALAGTGDVVSNWASGTNTTTLSVGNNNGGGNFSGIIADGQDDTMKFTMNGSGTQILSGPNTYSGATTVSSGGTLRAGIATVGGASPTSGAFGVNSSVTVNGGATLDLNDFSETIGSLSDNSGSGGTITSSTAGTMTLTTGGLNTGTSFAGVIQNGSGTVALTKIGTGMQTLGGVNTYSGATTITAGTLNLSSTGSIASGSTVGVGTAGTLAGNGTVGGNATLTGNGIINFSSGGNIVGTLGVTGGNWTGLGTVGGAVTATSGTLNVTGSLTSTAGVTIASGASLTGSSPGAIAGNVAVNAGGAIDFTQDHLGTSTTLAVGSLNLTTPASPTASTASNLTFTIGTSGMDTITSSGALTVGATGQAIVNVSGTATPGNYVLLSYSSQIGQTATGTAGTGATFGVGDTLGSGAMVNSGPFALGALPPGLTTYTLDDTATQLLLTVTGTPTPALAFWSGAYGAQGGNNNWGGFNATGPVTNWSDSTGTVDAGQLPGSNSDVVFTAAQSGSGGPSLTGVPISATLETNYTINSLTVNATAASVTVGGGNTLTINALASANDSAGTGILINSGAGIVDLTGITLVPANNQTWTNNSSSLLNIGAVTGNAVSSITHTVTINGSGIGGTTISGTIGDGSSGGNLALTVNTTGGTTTISGTNTYTGATILSAGTLSLTGTLGSSGGTAISSAATFNESSAGVIAGTSSLSVTAGTTTLAGVNTYSGGTTLSGTGTLDINSTTALGAAAGTFAINGGTIDNTSGAAEVLANANPITLGGSFAFSTAAGTANNNLTLPGAATITGSGTITLNSTAATTLTFSGTATNNTNAAITTTVNGVGNTLSLGGVVLNSGAATVTDVVNGTANVNITGPITNGGAGANGLTYSGTGTLTLSSTSTYTGVTNANGGTLRVVSGGVINSAGAINIGGASNATFSIAGGSVTTSGQMDIGGVASQPGTFAISSGSLTLNGGGIPLFLGSATSGNGATANATWNQTGGTVAITGQTDVGNSPTTNTITINGGSFTETVYPLYLGIVSGGSGTMTIGATGSPTISLVGIELAFYTGSSGTVNMDAGSLTVSGISVIGGDNTGGTGTWTQTGGTVTFNGQVNLGNNGTGSATISGGTFSDTANVFYLGVSNSGTLTISGTGVVSLQDLNLGNSTNATSTVDLNGGTLKLFNETGGAGLHAALGTNTFNFNGGTLQAAATFSAPTGVSTVVQSGGAIIDVVNTFTYTIPTALTPAISSTGGLTKLDTGTLILSGANTYTGGTTVSAGTLQLSGAGSTFGSGGLLTVSGGKADLNGISLTGSASVGGISDGGTSAGTITSSTAATLTDNITGSSPGSNETYSGTLSGSLTLAVSSIGSGVQTLSGTDTYTGGTTISAGTLAISGSGTLGATTGSLAMGGGTLDLGTTSKTVGAVTITNAASSGNTIQNGSLTGTSYAASNASGNAIVTANLLGSGAALTMSGAGTLTLSGANTYNGGTMVTAGTLRIGSPTALGADTSAVSVTSGAVLDLNGTTMTGTNALTLNGTGISSGGALTNSSSSPGTYAGLVTLGSSGVSIGGTGTIALSNTGTIGGSGYSLTLQGAGGSIASILGTGTAALAVNTTGAWQLSGANTFTSGVTISGGTLRIGNAGALNSTTPNAVTFSAVSGAATLDLNGYGTTVSGLSIASVASSNAPSQIITNSNTSTLGPATLTYAGATPSTFAGTLQDGVSTLALNVASGALTLNGSSTYSGGTTVTGGTLRVSNTTGSATGGPTSSVSVSSGATLSGGGGSTPGKISGSVSILGGGTIAPSGGGSLSPLTPGSVGTLTVGALILTSNISNASQLDYQYNGSAMPSPTLDLIAVTSALTLPTANNGTPVQFSFYPVGSTSNQMLAAGSGPYYLMTYGSLTAGSSLSSLSVNPNDLPGNTEPVFSLGTLNGFDAIELNIVTNNASAAWVSTGISPTDSNYGNSNNWSPESVPSGIGQVATFGTGSQLTVSVNGAYTVGQLNFNGSIPSASYYLTGTGSLTLNNSGSGASVNVSSGGLSPAIATTLVLADASLTTTFNVASGSSLDLSGTINESTPTGQQIVLSGGGVLTMEGSNTFTGGTTIQNGTLVANASGVLGTGSLTFNPGSGNTAALDVNTSMTVNNLSEPSTSLGTAQLNVASSTTLTLNQTASATFAGTLSLGGSAALTLNQGSGNTLTISGAPTLASLSSVLVNSGTLALTNNTNSPATVVGSASVSVASGATLQLAGSQAALSSAVNITTQGSGSAGDGALMVVGTTNQTVGVVSGNTVGSGPVTMYSGNTTVGDGTNAANLTATQILQNTLTIDAGSTVTIAPSGSGIQTEDDVSAATALSAVSSSAVASSAATADSDSSDDPFTAIQAAIASGSISSAKGQQLENRIAEIEQLATTDPGLDVSILEDRVLAMLPPPSVWSSSGAGSSSSPLGETGSGLLAVDGSTFGSSSDSTSGSAAAAFAPSEAFGGSPAAVPEPSTLLLAALGGIGILIAARRRTN